MQDIYGLYNLIGHNLYKIRKEQKLSQEKFAEILGLSRSYISQIEASGVDKGVSIDTLFLIATTYNIDIRRFFEGYEEFIKNDDK